MAITITEFPGPTDVNGREVQIVEGAPIAITPGPASVTLSAKTRIIKITGSGTITWPGGIVEQFSTPEFRGIPNPVSGGTPMTIAIA